MPSEGVVEKDNVETTAGKQRNYDRLSPKWQRKSNADEWRKRELEKRNCTKYHQLKFIERQKVERKLKSCRRLLLQAMEGGKDEEASKLRVELQGHLANHEYIEHYPKHLPYNSLFPKVDSDASRNRREQIRKLIRSQKEEGKNDADDGDSLESARQRLRGRNKISADKDTNKKGLSKKKRRKQAGDEEAGGEDTQKTKKKLKAKTRVSDQKEEAEDDGASPVQSRKLTKRKKGSNDDMTTSGVVESDDTQPKKKKKKLRGVVEDTKEETASTSREADSAAAPREKKSKQKKAHGMHASWEAKKSPKVSGAMVVAPVDRKVFDSDSDA